MLLVDFRSKFIFFKELYDNSQRKSRYLAIKFYKYAPYLNDLGLVKTNNLKKCLSDPNLTSSDEKENLSDKQLDRLLKNVLREECENKSELTKIDLVREQRYDVISEMKNECLKTKVDQQNNLIKEYYEKLSYVYNGFRVNNFFEIFVSVFILF